MDWSRIKTIFIISFLLLDIYLGYQFMNTRSEAKHEFFREVPIEEKLKNDDIQYKELPEELEEERYISVKPKVFTVDELLPNQNLWIGSGDGTKIVGHLNKTVIITGKFNPENFLTTVKDDIQYSEEYRFWKKDDQEGTIIYYQLYEGKMMYHNLNGRLTFYINDDNKVTSYEQTFIEVVEELSEEQKVLSPIGTIETLYKKGQLRPKSEITNVEIGYSTLVQLAASQVLAPTWRIVVNGEENLFVHAFEGQVIQFNNVENNMME